MAVERDKSNADKSVATPLTNSGALQLTITKGRAGQYSGDVCFPTYNERMFSTPFKYFPVVIIAKGKHSSQYVSFLSFSRT